jgi:hypothetical protein
VGNASFPNSTATGAIPQKRAEYRLSIWSEEHKKQKTIDQARLDQCTGALWWKKCPPRTVEAEQYWAKEKTNSACNLNPAGFACRDERKP